MYKTIIVIQILSQATNLPTAITRIPVHLSEKNKSTGASWYITNNALHKDLKIPSFIKLTTRHYKLHLQDNQLIVFKTIPNPTRKLNHKWSRDALE